MEPFTVKRVILPAVLILSVLLVSSGILLATAAAPSHKLGRTKALPKGVGPKVAGLIDKAGYRGILAIEWEGHKLKPVPGVKASKKLIEASLESLA